MNIDAMTLDNFIDALGSKAPTPGGGGAAAVCGAIAASLGSMVASLTIGKKKYAEVEEEMIRLRGESEKTAAKLLKLADSDAEAFAPLARAYSLPSGTETEKAEKDRIMEEALFEASVIPLEIMKECKKAVALIGVFADKGSVMAVSDAAAGAALCEGAIKAASLNIFINTKSMKNRVAAERLNEEANRLLNETVVLTTELFSKIKNKLEG